MGFKMENRISTKTEVSGSSPEWPTTSTTIDSHWWKLTTFIRYIEICDAGRESQPTTDTEQLIYDG